MIYCNTIALIFLHLSVRKFSKCTARGKVTHEKRKKEIDETQRTNKWGLYDHTEHIQYEGYMMFSFKRCDIAKIPPFQAANVDRIQGDIFLKNYPEKLDNTTQ